MVSRSSKLTVISFTMQCMYYSTMGETLIKRKFSYLMVELCTTSSNFEHQIVLKNI